jgi:hypothetical protein
MTRRPKAKPLHPYRRCSGLGEVLSTRHHPRRTCPLSGTKRTFARGALMSQNDPKRTFGGKG